MTDVEYETEDQSEEIAGEEAGVNGLNLLTKDQIREHTKATKLRRVAVPVPEWGGSVYVREMTGKERDEWENSIIKFKGDRKIVNTSNLRARLAIRTVVNEDWTMMFGENDLPWLTRTGASALDKIFKIAQDLSGISDEDFEELKSNLGAASDG